MSDFTLTIPGSTWVVDDVGCITLLFERDTPSGAVPVSFDLHSRYIDILVTLLAKARERMVEAAP